MSEERLTGAVADEEELELEEAQETEGGEDDAVHEDEGAEDAEDDGRLGAEEEERPRPNVSRNARRAERWRDRARSAEAERSRLEERLAALERNQQQPRFDPQAAQRAHQAELERIALLPPDQQFAALSDYNDRRYAGMMQAQEARIQDTLDRQDYERVCTTDASARRLRAEVERIRQTNPSVSRNVIASYLIGEEIRAKAVQAATRARRNGRAAIQRETTRPASAASTEGRSGRNTDDYKARLSNPDYWPH